MDSAATDALLGLAGRRALVVGGGQGMGRASALLLARAGADVGVADVVAERAEAVAEEVRALGRGAVACSGDVTLEEQARGCVERASDALDGLDVLVNVVGMASWSPLFEMDEATWRRDHDLNLKQHFYIGRAAAQRMRGQGSGGSIAMVASASGLFAAPNHASYGAAKAGLVALAKSMAQEWWPHGIRVNVVAPGAVRTPRIVAQQQAGEVPVGGDADRMAEVDDVAGALLFLSSALARRITGQTLVVDGGMTTRFPWDVG